MKALRNYVRLLCAILAVVGIAVAAFNLRVDPYASYPSIGRADLDDFRLNSSRTCKAERLARGGWETLVFGSSVANQTADPTFPHWDGARVYVAGLPGADIYEVRRAFDFALDRNDPRLVVIYVDLAMMSGARSVIADFSTSRFNPDLRASEYRLSHLLGWGTLQDSFQVLSLERTWTPDLHRIEATGFLRRPGDAKPAFKDFGLTLRKYFQEEFNRFTWDPSRFDDLRAMLARCRREGVRAVVLFPPFHALTLEAIRLLKMEGSFERVQREVLAAVEEAAPIPSSTPAPVLWDFTGWSGPRAESIPLDRPGAMHWYSDPIHPTAALGRQFLARALGREDLVDPAFRDFGVRLDRTNVDAHLAWIRAGREIYAREHPEETSRLAKIEASTQRERLRRLKVAGAAPTDDEGD